MPLIAQPAAADSLPTDWRCEATDYSCVEFAGWSGQDAWGFVANGTNGQNCTAYAAWRLSQDGVTLPDGWFQPGDMNANRWDDHAANVDGMAVNSTPAVGAIGVWNGGSEGHVAYVDHVVFDASGNWTEIWTSESNFTGTDERRVITPGSSYKPDTFLHFHDSSAGSGTQNPAEGDLIIRKNDGTMLVRDGGTGSYKTLGSTPYSFDISMFADVVGDDRADLIIRKNDGTMLVRDGGTGSYKTLGSTPYSFDISMFADVVGG